MIKYYHEVMKKQLFWNNDVKDNDGNMMLRFIMVSYFFEDYSSIITLGISTHKHYTLS